MKIATPVQNALVPLRVFTDSNGRDWLIFSYSDDDRVKPYRWPKVLKYDNKLFMWMSWNSDNNIINYKESVEKEIAFVQNKSFKN